jgi:hypothetical protein
MVTTVTKSSVATPEHLFVTTTMLTNNTHAVVKDRSVERESSLQVTKTTYSGLQEHRIIVYTATGQKAKPKVHLSTKTTVTGNSSKTPEACWFVITITIMQKGNRKTQVEHSSIAWRSTNRTSETTRDHSWAPTSRGSTVSQSEAKLMEHKHTGQNCLQPKRMSSRKEMHALSARRRSIARRRRRRRSK